MTTAPSKIIVGTDFSSASHSALGLARRLADVGGYELDVRHALQYPLPTTMFPSVSHSLSKLNEKAVADLAKEVAMLGDNAPIGSMRVEIGPPSDVLAADEDSVLVVLGHTARSLGTRIARSSVATEVLRRCRTPLVTVPEGIAVQPIQRIVLADDFSPAAGRLYRTLAALGLCKGTEVHVVYVAEGRADSLKPCLRDRATDRGFAELLADRVAEHTHGLTGSYSSHVLKAYDAESALCNYATETHADLLAVAASGKGTLDRLLLGSVAEAVMHAASCPVMIAH